jgi:hypothetical protein
MSTYIKSNEKLHIISIGLNALIIENLTKVILKHYKSHALYVGLLLISHPMKSILFQ